MHREGLIFFVFKNFDVGQVTEKTKRMAWHFRQGGFAQVKKFIDGPQTSPSVARYRKALKAGKRPVNSAAFEAVPAQVPDKTASGYTLEFQPLPPIARPKAFPHLLVATILDDFSAQAWGYEFDTLPLDPGGWQEQLAAHEVDLLLVESAWAGNGGLWAHQLTGPSSPSESLVSLLNYCKERAIPTVFWNKEDPPHFEDFLETARLFDQVFTSDVRLIDQYKKILGHNRVDTLAFAAQPAIHNPVRPSAGVHDRGAAFAGSYFAHKYPARREQMDYLLPAAQVAAAKTYQDFEIYSRFLGLDEKYQFPKQYQKNIVGSLPYEQMLTAYKAHKVFLNVNSVVDSPSMCARRIFEILASGTPVVTAPSAAIPEFFAEDELVVARDERDAELKIRALLESEHYRERLVHLAQRKIWAEHTYTHRAQKVLESVELSASRPTYAFGVDIKVSALVPTVRPQQVQHVLQMVGQQKDVKVQLVLLSHGFVIDEQALKQEAAAYGLTDVVLLHADRSTSLGACLNQLVAAADGDVLAKIDDDDWYGQYYLADMVAALRYSGAQVVGKNARYVYLEEHDVTVQRTPHLSRCFTNFVAGPTLVGWASVFREHPFAHVTTGEDTGFLESVHKSGGKIFATDPFNFVQRRSIKGHTWQADDLEFLANSKVMFYGHNLKHTNF